ncbi:leukotoxin LktA family filamentous adhesin, partial [Sutterella sp.]|uniref:leukotoxin LktA family filamentous adhesin n=1 Tax=Sutterella sp. TaxID=1981025 RepID=UPI0026E0F0F5
MNAAFRILWNDHRRGFVVVDEKRVARGKHSKSSVEAAAPAAAFAPAAGHLSGAALSGVAAAVLSAILMGAAPSAEATDITVKDGWTATTVKTNGNVHTVETTARAAFGYAGINKFSNFTLDKNQIANLKLPDNTYHLVNFVDNQVTVNGTVNAIKGSNIGGNLFFVTPTGITVGATGVINAGSFTGIVMPKTNYVTTRDDTEKYVTLDNLAQWRKADEHVNKDGSIVIEGQINAPDGVTLAAGKITTGSNAKIRTTITDFSQLVNIKDSETSVVIDAGLDTSNLQVTRSGDGDIILQARADLKDTSIAGDVLYHTAEAEINIGGAIEAKGAVKADATAINGDYV